MSECNCNFCQHSKRYMEIISKLSEDEQGFMRKTYDRLVMAEEERDMNDYIIKKRELKINYLQGEIAALNGKINQLIGMVKV